MSAQTKWLTVLAIAHNLSLFCSGYSHKTEIIQDPPSDNSAKDRASPREFTLKKAPGFTRLAHPYHPKGTALPLKAGEGELGVEVLAELPSPLAVSM